MNAVALVDYAEPMCDLQNAVDPLTRALSLHQLEEADEIAAAAARHIARVRHYIREAKGRPHSAPIPLRRRLRDRGLI
ncbi:MAG: hypothetical protein IPK20_26135 [Betaproteobacteria bacterium]|nr:hypothetical protein [Betaproteobacteria bacterium]